MNLLRRYLPILTWGAEYSRRTFTNDLIVAVIVTVMLIPQSLAYALLAGLPVQVGLFASMAPLLLYAVFGTSRTPRGRARGRGEPDDRRRHRPARVPGHAGVSRSGHRARARLGADAPRHGAAAARVSRELPQPPGRLGLHHGLGPPDRGRPARARPRHPRGGRDLRRDRQVARAQPRPDQSRHRGDRPRVAGVSLLGARQPQAPAAPRRARRAHRGHAREDRPRRRPRRVHPGRLGLRAGPSTASRSSARSPRACPASPCRRSTWRSGRSSSCPRC